VEAEIQAEAERGEQRDEDRDQDRGLAPVAALKFPEIGARGGRAAFIFAAARSAELISALRARRLEPKRIRFVHP
jgi:hypothetical protein